MKLLFDQNLSGALVSRLADLFPESEHVKTVGLMQADDHAVWVFAKEHGCAIVSKDSDFQQRSLLFGAPPKVIWLRVGNCPCSRIEKLIRDHSVTLHTFETDPVQSFLVLS
jgi:predicted nuclease of predicted toxin-antitoxin system